MSHSSPGSQEKRQTSEQERRTIEPPVVPSGYIPLLDESEAIALPSRGWWMIPARSIEGDGWLFYEDGMEVFFLSDQEWTTVLDALLTDTPRLLARIDAQDPERVARLQAAAMAHINHTYGAR